MVPRTAPAPGVRGSRTQEGASESDLNFVDIILAVGIKPLAKFLKGRKTAAGAIMAILAYALPMQDAAHGTSLEATVDLIVALLQFGAAWFGGGGLASWLLTARRIGRVLF